MCTFCSCILQLVIALAVPSFSVSNVDSFTITTLTDSVAGTPGTVWLVLWWNRTIYEYYVVAPEAGTSYTATSASYTIIGSSACNPIDYKMRIECDSTNTVLIDKIQVTTTDGTWYGLDSYCNPFGHTYSGGLLNDGACSDANDHREVICIDSDAADCAPKQQLVYFDIGKPNQWDSIAQLQDGTGTTVRDTTCDPTTAPSTHPSSHPTHPPSSNPSNTPNSIPTETPTATVQPSMGPSNHPTSQPSVSPSTIRVPSKAPSTISSPPSLPGRPTATTSEIASLSPTKHPAGEPSPSFFHRTTEAVSATEDITRKEDDSNVLVALVVAGGAIAICVLCVMLFIAYKCYLVHTEEGNLMKDARMISSLNTGYTVSHPTQRIGQYQTSKEIVELQMTQGTRKWMQHTHTSSFQVDELATGTATEERTDGMTPGHTTADGNGRGEGFAETHGMDQNEAHIEGLHTEGRDSLASVINIRIETQRDTARWP